MTDKAAKRAARAEQREARKREQQARAAQKVAKKKRLAEQTAAIAARLDRLKETQPDPSKTWDKERAEEPKALKKLKTKLEKRTTKDLSNRFMFQTLPKLPEPIAQPDFSEPDPVEDAPPREGLIPGTYRVIDRPFCALLDADPLPSIWTARHVGVRLIEAMEVLRRMPDRSGPGSGGSPWPQYRHEGVEWAYQAGAGTLDIGRNNIRRIATADEVARMNEALHWPMQFLSHCNFWALAHLNEWATDGDPDSKDAPTDLLQFIADALNAANEVVR